MFTFIPLWRWQPTAPALRYASCFTLYEPDGSVLLVGIYEPESGSDSLNRRALLHPVHRVLSAYGGAAAILALAGYIAWAFCEQIRNRHAAARTRTKGVPC